MTARRSLPSNLELFIETGVLNIHVRSISDLFPPAPDYSTIHFFFHHPFPSSVFIFERDDFSMIITVPISSDGYFLQEFKELKFVRIYEYTWNYLFFNWNCFICFFFNERNFETKIYRYKWQGGAKLFHLLSDFSTDERCFFGEFVIHQERRVSMIFEKGLKIDITILSFKIGYILGFRYFNIQ